MRPFIRHMAIRLRRLLILALSSPALLLSQPAIASQELTLQVMEVNKIDLSHRAVTLVIEHESTSEAKISKAENQDGALIWTTNGEQKKITVAGNSGSRSYALKIVTILRDGKTQSTGPEVSFSDDHSHDLLVGLPRGAGRCSIKYIATASLEQGIASEVQTITYTITGT